MGVDAVMKVRTYRRLTDEELAPLQGQFHDQWSEDGEDFPALVRDKYDGERVILVDSLDRYYGPGYERGHWPCLCGMGDQLMVLFGELGEVRYGSDTADTDWTHLAPWAEVRVAFSEWWEERGNLMTAGIGVSKRLAAQSDAASIGPVDGPHRGRRHRRSFLGLRSTQMTAVQESGGAE